MKKLGLILIIFSILPLSTFAANFLATPLEIYGQIKENRKEILKIQEQSYCYDLPQKNQVELDKLNALSTKSEEVMDRINYLVGQKDTNRTKCDQILRDYASFDSFKPNQRTNYACGSTLIMRGELCITPTEACQFYFGNNVSGQVDNSTINGATCVCNDGYKIEDKTCVVKPMSTSVATAISSPTNQELQKLITSLLAQVQILMAQLQAMGR